MCAKKIYTALSNLGRLAVDAMDETVLRHAYGIAAEEEQLAPRLIPESGFCQVRQDVP